MTSLEFVLWLNGATDMVGEAPSPEQWAAIREKLTQTVGEAVARKLLQTASEIEDQKKLQQRYVGPLSAYGHTSVSAGNLTGTASLSRHLDQMAHNQLKLQNLADTITAKAATAMQKDLFDER